MAVACALVLSLMGCGGGSGTAAAVPRPGDSAYALMQMNLCLSGFASCYPEVDYPAGVKDAVARIRKTHPDAVTLNEACSGDAVTIARRTGYHLRFARVIYNDKRLPCIKPGGRGVFGNAVLTKAVIQSSESRAFGAQAGPERREWLCARTRVGVEVCTAQLASPAFPEAAVNTPQCAELGALLARRALDHTVIFGGDVNRLSTCAPQGFWTRTDQSAAQDPGSQQVYGTGGLRSPSAQVLPARHTDHDFLLVRARRTAHP